MLKTRVRTALILAFGLIVVLFVLPGMAAASAFSGVVAIAGWEWAGLLNARKLDRGVFAVLTFAVCSSLYGFGMSYALLVTLWSLAALFWTVLVPLWFRYRWPLRANLRGYSVGWLVLLPSWAAMVSLESRNPWLLLAALALVWVADIAAYFSGRAFGRVRLAPSISPGKTWEGALGAAVAVLAYAAAIGFASGVLMSLSPAQVLLAAVGLLVLTLVSVVGDLFESLAKRLAAVKDSSSLLPGHGGVLDRIDSLTSTLPLVALAVLFAD